MTAKDLRNKLTDPDGNFRKWGTFLGAFIAPILTALVVVNNQAPKSEDHYYEIIQEVRELRQEISGRLSKTEDKLEKHIENEISAHGRIWERVNYNREQCINNSKP